MRTTLPAPGTFVLCLLFVFSSLSSSSQSITTGNGKFEFGVGVGPLFFLGDLGGNSGVGKRFVKDVNFPLTKMAKGAYVQFYAAEWLGIRAAINHGKLEGYDNIIEDKGGAERFRKDRNLQFRTDIIEAYVGVEFYPTVFLERYDGLKGKIRPYGIIGAGAFRFNPKGEYFEANGTSKWVELKPLRLEGQGMKEYADRKEYSLIQMEIPVGAGFKYFLKENFHIGLEVMHRKTFTDYIDDVSTNYIDANLFANYLTPEQSAMANQLHNRQNFVPNGPQNRPAINEQRGNPKQTDAFFSTVFRMGWRLPDWNSTSGRSTRQMRCPTYF
ncbi:MAG: hypothetical protein JWP69_1770 [Flaviaesturariibacter sp.]|nr:hypothetical protein [Flaviaesturariibacter sp.]